MTPKELFLSIDSRDTQVEPGDDRQDRRETRAVSSSVDAHQDFLGFDARHPSSLFYLPLNQRHPPQPLRD
jgi:hypothetical protein